MRRYAESEKQLAEQQHRRAEVNGARSDQSGLRHPTSRQVGRRLLRHFEGEVAFTDMHIDGFADDHHGTAKVK